MENSYAVITLILLLTCGGAAVIFAAGLLFIEFVHHKDGSEAPDEDRI